VTFENELYKFIKVDGKYEFCRVAPFSKSHADMAAGRKVEAAGLFSVWGKEVRPEDSWSTTLKVGCADQDFQEIAKLHGGIVGEKWR
jgi:hypothetical protein